MDKRRHGSSLIYGLGRQILTLTFSCPILITYKAIQLLAAKSYIGSREETLRMSYFKVSNT